MTPPIPADIPEHENALLPGTRLGEFEIRGVIGVGGFGIVYRALDHDLEREVAIKEYMPGQLAGRDATGAVTVRARTHAETFGIGLRSFVNEARLLARFDHPALLKVYRYWEANGTAYMAMPFYDGHTLTHVLRGMPAPPSQGWLMGVIEPLLGALELLHSQQIYHRDISLDNILLLEDGRPVLLDFGAARHVISDRTQALTAILKPNYAPIEQYAEIPGLKQGPWTDLYALGAVVYAALTSRPPSPAATRAVLDDLVTFDQVGLRLLQNHQLSYTPAFLAAWQACLVVKPGERLQSVTALRAALHSQTVVAPTTVPTTGPTVLPPPSRAESSTDKPGEADPEKTVIRSINRNKPAAALPPTPPIPVQSPPPSLPLPPLKQPPPPQKTTAPSRWGAGLFIGLGVLGLLLVGVGFYRPSPSSAPRPIPPVVIDPPAPIPTPASTPEPALTSVRSPAELLPATEAVHPPAPEASAVTSVPTHAPRASAGLGLPKVRPPVAPPALSLAPPPALPLVPPVPTTATEACQGEKGQLGQGVCMTRECKNAKFANRADCLRIRDTEAERY
ncbi:serine/threonine-protein kinase [Leptothrix ochracea]|uniref:serine/threonine-protein kinase n=1 Tax=Leptothrix ochracea TaxID=735331 RepID=UPI0034E21EC4